jgi:predicted metalloprotease
VRWRRGTGGGQVEDRRGASPVALGGGAGGVGLVVLLLFYLLGGGNGGGSGGPLEGLPELPAAQGQTGPDPDAELKDFVSFVVQDVQSSWTTAFANSNKQYEPTTLVLFEGATRTGCGVGSSQTGPFYCPLDRKVYLDLGFFRELRSRFEAPGDFAQAYVIAHEFGHHVQNLLGVMDDVQRKQSAGSADANDQSIRLELQADCLAGVWAHSAYEEELLESGDLEEGLAAAAAVGDDRIQEQSTGRINRENWTHGSSEQRTKWFKKGFDGGDPSACDTFSGDI